MNREALIDRLVRLACDLQQAEETLLRETVQHAQARFELECREADLLLRGVEGGNAEARKARLHVETLAHQERLQQATESRDRAALLLRSLQAEASLLRSVARLLAPE